MTDVRTRWPRAAVIVPTVLLVALPLIVAVVALAGRRWYPVLDLAMTEFRVRDVGGRRTPLIGLPGRIGELPDQGSHPGPLSFWALGPTYRVFGSSAWAMEVATVALQLVWISLAVWIGHRRLGAAGVALVAAIVAVLTRGYGLSVLTQPWNPYLPLLAWLVVLLATWSVFSGDDWMLVPLVVAASFAAQTHIPYLTMAGGLGVAAIGAVVWRWTRSAKQGNGRGRFPPAVPITIGLFAVLWLAPLVDEVRRTANISALIEHFGSPPEEPIGLGGGFRLLLRHLDAVDGFLRLVTGQERFLQAGFDPDGPIWPGAIVLVLWIAAAIVAWTLGHRPLIAMHAVIGLALVLSLISMSRIFGVRWFYLTLWAWTTTALLLVAVAWTAVVWLRRRRARSTPEQRRITAAVAALAAVATASMIVLAPSTDHPEEYLGETVGELVGPTADALRSGVGEAAGGDAVYGLAWTDAYFFGSQAFGLLSELERDGIDARVYPFFEVPATPYRTVDGPVAADVVFATGGFIERWRGVPGMVEVARHDPRSPEELAEFLALRDDLIAELEADGLDELVSEVDTNLFGVRIDQRLSTFAREASARMLLLGEEAAVFIGPAGISQRVVP